jgi:pimeloyl-ACP methyl ester carboxylesterase
MMKVSRRRPHHEGARMVAGTVDGPNGPGASAGRSYTLFDASAAGMIAPWLRFSCYGRPSLLLEQRAGLELAELFSSPVYYGVGVPRGVGGHVLLIPGFMGSDSYLTVLDGWLRRIGHRPHLSGLHLNAGRPFDLIARLLRRLDAVATTAGSRVTIIGHSLGGVFGRVLARLRPDLVAHTIALGSPLTDDPRKASHPLVGAMADLLLREGATRADREAERLLERELITGPLPDDVRLTSVYTREDAVVHWRACLDPDPRATCHEVRGTHIGLAWNAQVYRHLGHALMHAA